MSRIGNRIITVPAGVTVTEENGFVKVTGPKGTLEQKMLNKNPQNRFLFWGLSSCDKAFQTPLIFFKGVFFI